MLNSEKHISIATLHELLRIDHSTGALFWLERPARMFRSGNPKIQRRLANNWNSRYANTAALDCADGSGHLTGRIFNRLIYAHRVVFAMTNGRWPDEEIDHENGTPSDNVPNNLRDVPHLENLRNQKLAKNNTSGFVGVSWNKRLGKWASHITVLQEYKHLGFFEQIEDAVTARKEAGLRYGFHENHGRKSA